VRPFDFDGELLGDIQAVTRLKEKVAQFQMNEDFSNRIYELHCVRAEAEEIFTVAHLNQMNCLPYALFHPSAFNSLCKFAVGNFEAFDYGGKYYDLYCDPEDYQEEFCGGRVLSLKTNNAPSYE